MKSIFAHFKLMFVSVFIASLVMYPICAHAVEPEDKESLSDLMELWGDRNIVGVRCLVAKAGMVMLVVEFDAPLAHADFNGKDYALIKWTPLNSAEVKINELVRELPGIVPAFGFHFKGFTLRYLLPKWPHEVLQGLADSINGRAEDNVVDRNKFFQRGKKDGKSTVLVMPLLRLYNLEDYIGEFGSSPELKNMVEKFLGPTFTEMAKLGVVHGDLALRNVGVIFASDGTVVELVLFDFGGRQARILGANENIPYKESLSYLLGLVENKAKKPRREKRKGRFDALEDIKVQADFQGFPSPLHPLPNGLKITVGSPYRAGKENDGAAANCVKSLFQDDKKDQ